MITSYLSNSIFAYLVLSNIRSRRWWIFFKGHQTDSSLLSPILAEHIGQRAEADPSLNRLHPVKSSGAKTGNPPLGWVGGWVKHNLWWLIAHTLTVGNILTPHTHARRHSSLVSIHWSIRNPCASCLRATQHSPDGFLTETGASMRMWWYTFR